VRSLLERVQPSAIVHLAGQASIEQSFKQPYDTFQSNLQPLINLFEGCRALNLTPRILVITSAEIYGRISADQLPVRENAPLRPANPYSVSKAAQDLLAQQYFMSYGLPIVIARPFNHLGAGQSEAFVATAFAMQIARIEADLQAPVMKVGNLQSSRDFTDVRDIVRAYTLLLDKGQAGEAYNVASGTSVTIVSLLQKLLALSSRQIEITLDTERLRPIDVPVIAASYEKLNAATNWQPQIDLDSTLRAVLDDCRQRLQLTLRS
jgi:GDP-4-dehydro-6-deoxy-D-mannose reductase